jgi:hypothetical protein
MINPFTLLSVILLASIGSELSAAVPATPAVDLVASLSPSPIKRLSEDGVKIVGSAVSDSSTSVRVRVTTSFGETHMTEVKVEGGRFECRYPQAFNGAPPLRPSVLYVDATDLLAFGSADHFGHQAEITLIVSGGKEGLPDLPLVFTDDFLDVDGRKDQQAMQWSRQRTLVNLFMHSRGAKLMRIHKPGFDLGHSGDFAWFKDHATLYDFDHRDRDWSTPLGNRPARGFWQAVWNTWFNASNNHPWDGDGTNKKPENYRPYTFTNDPADILILYRMLQQVKPAVADNRRALADEVMTNLLAMQHRGSDNFARQEASGKQELYTAGAFHYGMFETGEWLTEGKGWFINPDFRDFAWGGVFNGRGVWALGESLKANPQGPLAVQLGDSLKLALRFCLSDGLQRGYTYRTKSGLPIWNRTAGEHAYLLLGMLSACEVRPDFPVQLTNDQSPRPLRQITIDALNALTESVGPDGQWTRYANATAMNIAALAEGARVLADSDNASAWKAAAMKAADAWLVLKPLPERPAPTPMFGHMKEGDRMTFILGKGEKPHVPLYIGGHWLHALAVLHKVSGEKRYLDRANAILGYYCGDNSLRARLLNELGAVNNRIIDADSDGIEDILNWDAYPESTSFVQIGLLHLLRNQAAAVALPLARETPSQHTGP